MKIGDIITATIYGHAVRCKVLAIHAAGTVDVQRADGQCFRISGLTLYGATMKSYQVELKCISYVSLEVEADSPEAAEAAAWLELQTGDYDDSATSWEVESVEATA